MVAQPAYSIVLPAKNEAVSLAVVLPALKSEFPQAEIIVVDDGSTDMTADVCAQNDVIRVAHQVSLGNGAAIKSGARRARGKAIVFMDADSQHNPQDIHKLLARFEVGSDMVVGARTAAGHANVGRLVANTFYSRFASWVTGRVIPDLTSGFRVVNRRRFMQFLHLLPNGFSYPTTITMAFMRAGYDVEFVAIPVHKRVGRSHIRILRDGLRFLLIIFKVGTLYSPLRIFLPVATTFFVTGLCYYLYTFTTSGRFTNMSALLFINAVLIFMIGLVSEQITALTYSRSSTEQD